MIYRSAKAKRFQGALEVPGDKSLSHRALIFGALADGVTEIEGLVENADVTSTGHCLTRLGVEIRREKGKTLVTGRANHFTAPTETLDCGNSGTTMRTLMGVLAGQAFETTLVGDESLQRRPMTRVARPLEAMGASIRSKEGKPPITIRGAAELKGVSWDLEVASAQVKTAILLAGLKAKGPTKLTGKLQGRDHTERLFPHFGVRIEVAKDTIVLPPGQTLKAAKLRVPGDPSSAAFFAAAAAALPGGKLEISNLLLNPTRTGFFRVLERMGAKLTEIVETSTPEPVGRLLVSSSALKGTSVRAEEVPSLIDEIPMLAVLATQADGVTEIRGAEELRVKESDRIETIAENLRRLGATLETFPDGLRVPGRQNLKGTKVDSFGDHRIAMAMAVAGLFADGVTEVADAESASVSFPAFFTTLEKLCS